MPPPPILDLAELDFARILANREEIAALNPQRYEFALLDGILLLDYDRGLFAGYYDALPDAWWTRGHIPGRPLMPGVLMIECAAQLASYVVKARSDSGRFLGFSGVDDVKFRGSVVPPARLVIVAKALDVRPRRFIMQGQGFVGGEMVFEAVITGMPV